MTFDIDLYLQGHLALENRVRSGASIVLDGFFWNVAQMITIIRRCVAWYVFFRFLKFYKYFGLQFSMDFFHIKHKWSLVWEGVLHIMAFDLDISSRSFGLGLESRVRSVASTVLNGFFPYLIQVITSMRMCVACDDIWPWPTSSRSFNLDFEKSCPLCKVFSSRSIISIFATNNRFH